MASHTHKYSTSNATEASGDLSVDYDSSKTLLLQGNAQSPQGWPAAPRSVKSPTGAIIADVALDILLFAASLAFLTFALTVRSYNQASTALNPRVTDALISASKFGPSVLPILFACVVGRAAQAILLWRLERGTHIGTLDMLAGSTSFTSAITSQLRLRMLNGLGLALVAIWSLSPVGGQASFRQVSIGSKVFKQPASFNYMIPSGNFTLMLEYSYQSTFTSTQNGLFGAAVIAPKSTKSSPRDLWGNVKIPMIEPYETAGQADGEGWFDMSGSEPVYSSLVGIPMAGMKDPDFTDYYANIEANYFNLDCMLVDDQAPSGFSGWTSMKNGTPVNSYYFASSWGADMWLNDNMIHRQKTDMRDLKPANFTYWSWGPTGMSNCTITTTYVEAGISCSSSSACAASRLRRSQLRHPPPSFTHLDSVVSLGFANWKEFAAGFVSSSTGHEAAGTPTQYYLVAPDDPLSMMSNNLFRDQHAPMSVPNDVFSIRLGQLMNAYWIVINAMTAVTAGITPSTALIGEDSPSVTDTLLLTDTAAVNGTKGTQTSVIECHSGWVTVLSIASMVMIIASLVNPIVVYFLNRAPDLMLNISSLATRNNPYVQLPENGTFMSASERARLLKSVKVRFGDVDPAGDTGSLAIASIGNSTETDVERVQKGRLYR